MPSLNTGNAILSNAITVDGSYNVGIGTSTPLGKLHVSSPTAVSAYIVSSGGDYDTNLYLGYGSVYTDTYIKRVVGNLSLGTSATDRVYITSGGNVGIGTTSPSYLLHAYSTNASTARIYLQGTSNFVATQFGNTGGAFYLGIDDSAGANFTGTAYGRFLYSSGAYPLVIATNGSERMRITSSGNVGIGETPTSSIGWARILTLNGNNAGDTAYILKKTGSAQEIAFGTDGSALYIDVAGNATASNNNIRFRTSDTNSSYGVTERMRITSDGKALFGTSTAGYGLFSTQRVTINPISDGIVVGPLPQNNSAYTTQAGDNTGTRYALYIANGSSSNVGSISFTSATTSYNITSDYRLKQDLKEFNGLSILSKVKTYDFEWKIDNSRMYGVIAHELQDVIPYAVLGEKDGEQMQSVDYSKIVPVLVKAIQEQQAMIEAQQQQINQLINK